MLVCLIYTLLAFLLVELVGKTIKLKYILLSGVLLTSLLFAAYNNSPDQFSERKSYRLIAPYINPESNHLSKINEADRESYSTFFLNLKNGAGMVTKLRQF